MESSRFQALEVGGSVDVDVTPRQGDGVYRPGVAGKQRSGAAVAAQLSQLREMGGGEEGGNTNRAG